MESPDILSCNSLPASDSDSGYVKWNLFCITNIYQVPKYCELQSIKCVICLQESKET